MNKVVREIEDKVLEELQNWYDIQVVDRNDDGSIKEIIADCWEMNIAVRVVLPCGETNFHFLLQADYMDDGREDPAIDCWYDSIDDLLPELKSTKIHERIYDFYEEEADIDEI